MPKKRKLTYKVVVPFLLLAALLIFALVQNVLPQTPKEVNTALQFCGLSPKKAKAIIQNDVVENTKTFKDYGVYGETLGIYENSYQVGKRDPLMGKTIYIRNLCNDDEYSFLMGAELDSKIPIEQLGNGIYAVEILNGLERQRLVSEDVIQEVFTASAIHGEAKHIEMIANKNAFMTESSDVPLDDHYLFFNVKTKTIEEDQYDIILDPNGLTMHENGKTNYGSSRKDLSEAVEMYRLAEGVKTILEQEGYSVKIIRDNTTPINQHGENSRTQLAYEAKAKYYFQFNLRFSFYKPDKGMTILYSNYATNGLASSIMESLNENTDLVTSNFTSKNNPKGVYRSLTKEGYDYRHVIREVGGQFTGAGKTSEFKDDHQAFSNSKSGMQAVVIDYGFINDDHTYNTWVNQNEAIIKATAEGILKGLK